MPKSIIFIRHILSQKPIDILFCNFYYYSMAVTFFNEKDAFSSFHGDDNLHCCLQCENRHRH